MRTVKSFFILFIILFVCLMPAIAGWITIEITAQVADVYDPLGWLQGSVDIGDIIIGTYTYDTAVMDSAPQTEQGYYEYYGAPAGMTLNVGNLSFRTDPANVQFSIVVHNNPVYALSKDFYCVSSYNNLPLANGTIYRMGWRLSDSNGIALVNDALPLTALDLDKWNSNELVVGIGERGVPPFLISAVVTSAHIVPEPATIFLFALGSFLLRKKK